MSTFSNGCVTVNGGTLQRLPDGFEVELMGSQRGFSTHVHNLTATYIRNTDGQASKILIYVNDKQECYVSFFKKVTGLQHYTSKKYDGRNPLPKKYADTYLRLCQIHASVFGR